MLTSYSKMSKSFVISVASDGSSYQSPYVWIEEVPRMLASCAPAPLDSVLVLFGRRSDVLTQFLLFIHILR